MSVEQAKSRISIRSLAHRYGHQELYRNFNFQVEEGEWVALLGPSGCGKSTLLRLIAGHEKVQKGEVTVLGSSRTVFQKDGLFPWLTIRENLALSFPQGSGGGVRDPDPNQNEWIQRFGIEGYLDAYPHQISVGMRQRVEIARALASNPDVLLLDEPFSSLDFMSRILTRNEVSLAVQGCQCAVLLVTHDIEEALQVADRVLVVSSPPILVLSEIILSEPKPRPLDSLEVQKNLKKIMAEWSRL